MLLPETRSKSAASLREIRLLSIGTILNLFKMVEVSKPFRRGSIKNPQGFNEVVLGAAGDKSGSALPGCSFV